MWPGESQLSHMALGKVKPKRLDKSWFIDRVRTQSGGLQFSACNNRWTGFRHTEGQSVRATSPSFTQTMRQAFGPSTHKQKHTAQKYSEHCLISIKNTMLQLLFEKIKVWIFINHTVRKCFVIKITSCEAQLFSIQPPGSNMEQTAYQLWFSSPALAFSLFKD